MSAGWGWVDFSTNDRNRIAAIMSMLRERGVLDELGIGVLRDAISDQLVPGLSTIQRRAKYFLFTPIIVRRYFQSSKSESLPAFFHREETEMLEKTASNYRKPGRNQEPGIFGITLKHARDLQAMPSSIYWGGQLTLGLIDLGDRRPNLSQYLAANSQKIEDQAKTEEDDHSAGIRDKSGIVIPKKIIDAFDPKTIELSKLEAEFLRETFVRSLTKAYPDSLLLQLFTDPDLTAYVASDNAVTFEEVYEKFFTPQSGNYRPYGTQRLRALMQLGFHFSSAIYGAMVMYTLLLEEKIGRSGDSDAYWTRWTETVGETTLPLDFSLLREIAPDGKAMRFLHKWIEAVRKQDQKNMRDLIIQQEFISKTGRARLKKPSLAPEEFEDWPTERKQEYRIQQAQIMVRDIFRGLQRA